MDTTDPEIVFDEQGVCNHYHDYDRLMTQRPYLGRPARYTWNSWSEQMKQDGQTNRTTA
jgi:hypothetical protein